MTDYPFNMQLAVTSLDENTVVRDGSVSVYDPEDTDGTTLLTLTTPGGVPLANPLTTNEYGFVQPFVATLPQVMWRSGDYEGYFESYKGLRDEAAGARDAAEESALMAIAAANGLQIGTVETGVDPAATITGTAPDRLLNFVLPQGPEGPEGPPATAGPLDGLTDVTAPSPTNGQALVWDSATSQWKNTTLATGVTTLDGLTDVTAPSPTNGQALIWDAATSQWKNTAIPAAPITVIAKTANYTLTTADDAVTFNGASLTATIPDPTTCSTKVFRIKNLHTTALSVVSAGTSKTIDGAASVNVWQYQTLTVVSDGATWYVFAGRDLVPSSTYKPFINDTTSGTGPTFKVWTNINSTEPAIWADSSGVANRPAFRATVFSGSPANIFEGGQWVGGGYYPKFHVDVNGKIVKLNGVDFTYAANAANPQDQIATTYGEVTDTNPGLTYLKRAAGTSWNYQPFGYFGQPQTKTANYTVDFKDTVLIGNGSSITFTLPDPTTSGLTAGRKFEIKNIHATALTVVSAGTSKTIDGAASLALAQYEGAIVTTDGTQWLLASKASSGGTAHNIGDDLIQTGTYNPTATGVTTGSQPVFKITHNSGSRTAPILWVGNAGTASGNPQGIRVEKGGSGDLLSLSGTQSSGITHFAVDNTGMITRMFNLDNFWLGPRSSDPEGSVVSQYGLFIGKGGGWSVGDRPGRLWHKAWHHSYSDGWVAVGANTDYQIKTANYTMAVMDELIIGNGSSITITLPDPAQIIMGGRIYRVKNVNATALTVVSAGTSKTIDGAASKTLNQWDKITVTSDGTQWLII